MSECSANKFFGCWTENFLQHAQESDKEETLGFATWSFSQNPEMFKDMMADGFCHCDGTCK
jgi:hypothetical protein